MNKKLVILLDAGHGGIIDGKYQTSGKRSPKWKDGTQYFEGVGNRQIRDILYLLLIEAGYTVYKTAFMFQYTLTVSAKSLLTDGVFIPQ